MIFYSLPSCVVNFVKNVYPSSVYTGFCDKSPIFHRKINSKKVKNK